MQYKDKIIAVVGVSDNISKYGYKIFTSLVKTGYNVYGVNPKLASLEGKRIYPDLEKLPQKPDIVITVVPPDITEKIVDDCINLKIGHIWMQPGSESQKAVEKAKSNNIQVTNACFMVINKLW